AADAIDDRRPAVPLQQGDLRVGHPVEGIPGGTHGLGLAQACAVDRHEGGTEALGTGEVLVAARLVDPPLAPEFGLQRLHGNAVRLYAAVAAPLANQRVDDDPPVGIGKGAALAPAA